MYPESLYGIPCDHELKEAELKVQDIEPVAVVFQNALEKRKRLVEENSSELHSLMQMHIDGESLSDHQMEKYKAWQNLNDSIEEMQVFFCDEYNREVLNFTSATLRCVYKFLVAFDKFETIYPDETDVTANEQNQ